VDGFTSSGFTSDLRLLALLSILPFLSSISLIYNPIFSYVIDSINSSIRRTVKNCRILGGDPEQSKNYGATSPDVGGRVIADVALGKRKGEKGKVVAGEGVVQP
jgi:hypothetical protein